MGEYYFSQKLREIEALNKAGRQVINLGIGSPDLPPHPEVIRVLQENAALPGTHAYQSYKGAPELRQAIADWYRKWYGVELDPATDILPLMGSKEGIMHLCMTYLNKGDEVLVPDPGYPTYRSAVSLAGGKCISYPLKEKNNYEPDFTRLEKKNLERVKLMFVNYPQMPTGRLPTAILFEKLVAFARAKGILLVHDNPYSFILNDEPMSLLSVKGARDCVVELNSLSKSHNMAGWRVGMLCGDEKIISDVLRFRSNMDSGMFLPLQRAAARALALDEEWFRDLNSTYLERREAVFALLDILQCGYTRSQAGLFVWARVPRQHKNGYELSDTVLQGAGVFITPGGIFGKRGEDYVRVSLCCPAERIREAGTRIRKAMD